MKRNFLFKTWFYNIYTEELNPDVEVEILKLFNSKLTQSFKNGSPDNLYRYNYYNTVWNLTNEVINQIKNIERRSINDLTVDHIISLSYGFKNNIQPSLIASLQNLQMISMRDNAIKGEHITAKGQYLIDKFNIELKPNNKVIKFERIQKTKTIILRGLSRNIPIPPIRLTDSTFIEVIDLNTACKIKELNITA